jgi:hypothetical protein
MPISYKQKKLVFANETLALSKAVDLSDDLGVGKVIFETDCSSLKNALCSNDYDLGPAGVLLSDIKFWLRMRFY